MLRYYIVGLVVSLLLVMGVNILAGAGVVYSVLAVVLGAIFIFLLDALIAWVIHKLPAEWFCYKKKIFQVAKRERKFYEKIDIKNWKDKVPEMGQLCNFKKDKIQSFDATYIDKFLTETCYAEVVHIGMLCIGLLVFLAFPVDKMLAFALPLFLINAILQIPPILIQRYNRPKLELVLIRAERSKKMQESD